MIKLLIVLFSIFSLSACTNIGLFIANLPAALSNSRIITNVEYGQKTWQKLDIYLPSKEVEAPEAGFPVVMFFYGGSWEDGNKEMYAFVGKDFSDRGYITVISDYGKYPTVQFPEFVNDGAKALAWTYNTIKHYGGDPDNINLSGHSAGAYIAAMITVDNRYLEKLSLDTTIINAFAGLAGPYDFVPNTSALKAVFEPVADDYSMMQVTSFVSGDEPPMLLMWGEQDKTVYRRNLDLLAAEIRRKKGHVETKLYPNMNHVDMVKNLMWMLPSHTSLLDDIVIFFKQQKTKVTAE